MRLLVVLAAACALVLVTVAGPARSCAGRTVRDPGRRLARVRAGHALGPRREARPAGPRRRPRHARLAPDRAAAGRLPLAAARTGCCARSARAGSLPSSRSGGRPGWANGGSGPERRADRRRSTSSASREQAALRYRVRPALGHVERAEQGDLAAARLAADVRLADPQPGLSRHQGGQSPRALVAGGVTGAARRARAACRRSTSSAGMDRAGARLDAYAHHPYPVYPGDTPFIGGCKCKTITMATLERLLRLVGQAFPRARVWLTEYAYQTNPPDHFGVSPGRPGALRRRVGAPRVRGAEGRHAHPLPVPRRARTSRAGRAGSRRSTGGRSRRSTATMLPLAQVVAPREPDDGVGPGAPRRRAAALRAPGQLVGGRWTSLGGTARRPRPRLPQPDGSRAEGREAPALVPRTPARQPDARRPLTVRRRAAPTPSACGMSSAARSTSSSVMPRCVTARTTVGWIVAERPTPASRRRGERLVAVEAERREVDLDEVRLHPLEVDREAGGLRAPRRARVRARGRRRAARRGGRGRRRPPPRRSRPGASRRRTGASPATRARSARREPASSAPSGQPRPFERQSVTVSKRDGDRRGCDAERRRRR